MDAPLNPFHKLECPASLGIFVTIEAGVLSLLASFSILVYAGYRYMKWALSGRREDQQRPLDATDSALFLNLMFWDMIQAIGMLPSIQWLKDMAVGGVDTHSSSQLAYRQALCVAQGALKHVGNVGVAITSLALAIYTFGVISFDWRPKRYLTRSMLAAIWITVALICGIPNIVHRKEGLYGSTQYWCWIRSTLETSQLMAQYFWLWLVGLVMALLYGILYFVMKGRLVFVGLSYRWYPTSDPSRRGAGVKKTPEQKRTEEIALLMLYYPAVYILCILPNSTIRWIRASDVVVSPGVIFFCNTIYQLSGLFNACLFLLTRDILKTGNTDTKIIEEEIETTPQTNTYYVRNTALGHIPDLRQREQHHIEQRQNHEEAFLEYGVPPPTTRLNPHDKLSSGYPLPTTERHSLKGAKASLGDGSSEGPGLGFLPDTGPGSDEEKKQGGWKNS